MRLGILSDTHDQLARTRSAIEKMRDAGADALVHCGDLTTTPIVAAMAVLPAWFVLGNNDADDVAELTAAADRFGPVCLGWGGTFELGGRRIGVAHGHMTSDIRRVLAEEPEFLLTGHSHIPHDTTTGPVRRINPGALHRAKEFTAAVLDLESGELQWLRIDRS